MKNIRVFLSENFQFLEMKFSIYLNRRVFVMFYSETNQIILCAQYVLLLTTLYVDNEDPDQIARTPLRKLAYSNI